MNVPSGISANEKTSCLGAGGDPPLLKIGVLLNKSLNMQNFQKYENTKKNEKKGPLNRLPSGEGEGYLGLLDISTKIMFFFTPSQRGTYIFIL